MYDSIECFFSASTVDADQMIDCVQNIYATGIIFLSYLL